MYAFDSKACSHFVRDIAVLITTAKRISVQTYTSDGGGVIFAANLQTVKNEYLRGRNYTDLIV